VTEPVNNERFSFSATGMTALVFHEGLKRTYYNDPTNCTYGIGTLAHFGPCTSEELNTVVTDQQIHDSLHAALRDAERTIKKKITRHQLNQDQYDALVSFVYNRGASNSKKVLELADEGKLEEVAAYMNRVIYMRVVDNRTGQTKMKAMPGLIQRRRYEARPFREAEK
jgi:lysozyme